MAFAEPSDGARNIKQSSPGRGQEVTLIGTVQIGDPIYGGSTGWARACAADDTKRTMMIASQSGVSGDKIIAYPDVLLDFGSGCTATIGADLFLSDTAGDYSASTGTWKQVIGRMLTGRVAHVWGVHS